MTYLPFRLGTPHVGPPQSPIQTHTNPFSHPHPHSFPSRWDLVKESGSPPPHYPHRTMTLALDYLALSPNAAPTPDSANSSTYSLAKATTFARTTVLSALHRNASPNPLCISSRTPWTHSTDTLTAEPLNPGSPAMEDTSTSTSTMKPSTAPSNGPQGTPQRASTPNGTYCSTKNFSRGTANHNGSTR